MMLKRIALTAMFVVCACGLAQAADFSSIPNPLKNVKADQWVSYTAMGGVEQKQTVTKVEGEGDDRVVTINMEFLMNGNVMQAQETKISLKDANAEQEAAWKADPNIKVSEVTVNAAGKDIKATLIETTEQGITTKLYLSEEIPVSGIVKMESSALTEPLMVVKDYSK